MAKMPVIPTENCFHVSLFNSLCIQKRNEKPGSLPLFASLTVFMITTEIQWPGVRMSED